LASKTIAAEDREQIGVNFQTAVQANDFKLVQWIMHNFRDIALKFSGWALAFSVECNNLEITFFLLQNDRNILPGHIQYALNKASSPEMHQLLHDYIAFKNEPALLRYIVK